MPVAMTTHAPSRLLKEAGTALAVLAIYLLTVLSPLHQAAASQRDFAKLGYQSISQPLCGSFSERNNRDTDQGSAAVKCPAPNAGKSDFGGMQPLAVAFSLETTAAGPEFGQIVAAGPAALPRYVAAARAPPALS